MNADKFTKKPPYLIHYTQIVNYSLSMFQLNYLKLTMCRSEVTADEWRVLTVEYVLKCHCVRVELSLEQLIWNRLWWENKLVFISWSPAGLLAPRHVQVLHNHCLASAKIRNFNFQFKSISSFHSQWELFYFIFFECYSWNPFYSQKRGRRNYRRDRAQVIFYRHKVLNQGEGKWTILLLVDKK